MKMTYSNPASGPVVYFDDEVMTALFGPGPWDLSRCRASVRISESNIHIYASKNGPRILTGQNTALPYRLIFPKNIPDIEILERTGPIDVKPFLHRPNNNSTYVVEFSIPEPNKLTPPISRKSTPRTPTPGIEPNSLEELRMVLKRFNELVILHYDTVQFNILFPSGDQADKIELVRPFRLVGKIVRVDTFE